MNPRHFPYLMWTAYLAWIVGVWLLGGLPWALFLFGTLLVLSVGAAIQKQKEKNKDA